MSIGKWLAITFVICVCAPLIDSLDRAIASFFYKMGQERHTLFLTLPHIQFINRFLLLPGQLLAVLSGSIWALSFVASSLKPYRNSALFLSLVVGIGAGIIINGVLKEHWNRPRPKQTIEYGGKHTYRPFYARQPKIPPYKLRSFASGHVSMGVYFYTLYLVGQRRKNRWLSRSGLVLTWILTPALIYGRLTSGAHYFSDVLFSVLIMVCMTQLIDWCFKRYHLKH